MGAFLVKALKPAWHGGQRYPLQASFATHRVVTLPIHSSPIRSSPFYLVARSHCTTAQHAVLSLHTLRLLDPNGTWATTHVTAFMTILMTAVMTMVMNAVRTGFGHGSDPCLDHGWFLRNADKNPCT